MNYAKNILKQLINVFRVKKNRIFCILIILFVCAVNQTLNAQLPLMADINSLQKMQIDSANIYIISTITITGNAVTNKKVIMRELSFAPGDTISGRNLVLNVESSRNNLLKTNLFNYVTIVVEPSANDFVSIVINVEERWYLWPAFSIQTANRNFSAWLQDMDFSRIEYGVGLKKYNFRGFNEKFSLNITRGINKIFSLHYSDIYFDKKRSHSISLYAAIFRQDQVQYNTHYNKPVYYKSTDNYAYQDLKLSFSYRYRQNLQTSHMMSYRFVITTISDTVFNLNPQYFGNNSKKAFYNQLQYEIRIDKRNSSYYPLTGNYGFIQINKYGLGFKQENINYANILVDSRWYFMLSNRFYAANQLSFKKAFNHTQPFFIKKSLGYNTYRLNGYDFYVFDGEDYIFNKTILKFELIPTRIIHLQFIPLPKFNKIHFASYINIFANFGYVADYTNSYIENNNTYINQWLSGYGAGIDFVTYYDKVLRIEYSINKASERGFFFHFYAPI